MSTNFYATMVQCEHCGNSTTYHVGKRWSGGFILHVDSHLKLLDLSAIIEYIRGGNIVDEYGNPYTLLELLSIIGRDYTTSDREFC